MIRPLVLRTCCFIGCLSEIISSTVPFLLLPASSCSSKAVTITCFSYFKRERARMNGCKVCKCEHASKLIFTPARKRLLSLRFARRLPLGLRPISTSLCLLGKERAPTHSSIARSIQNSEGPLARLFIDGRQCWGGLGRSPRWHNPADRRPLTVHGWPRLLRLLPDALRWMVPCHGRAAFHA